ncbi:uncharacterized protein [Littorina saxatilis]|uniref:CUB domain-containing protein n=2 Tax=Littorina saxatilis TaxID=31220 RepID=A0AAN9BC75_9CAEN
MGQRKDSGRTEVMTSVVSQTGVTSHFLGGCWNMCRLWRSLLLVLVVLSLTENTTALTPLVHMTNKCHKTVHVNESLVLDLTEDLKADRVLVGHLSCVLTLQAPPGARLYLHVLQLAISDKAEMPDRLHLYGVSSSGRETRLTPSMGLYGVLERPFLIYNTAGIIVPDFRSAGPGMRLDYQGKPTVIYRGFRVLVTVFYSPMDDGSCRQGTFYCPYAGTCIPSAVRCDSLPNCGLDDSTDEKSCQREDIVTNLMEEYATKTAIIAGVTGILVFLGVAALVLLFLIRYHRIKDRRDTDQSMHFTSRGGGACKYRNETDLTRLYAPPSYEDVMIPNDKDEFHHRVQYPNSDPPPTYSAAVATLVHQEGNDSSEDERDKSRGSKHRPARAQPEDRPPSFELERLRGACADGSEEDVRMHGTWPSDTDEEDEVKERRKKKGGKGKGKSRRCPEGDYSTKASRLADVGGKKRSSADPPLYENTRLESSPLITPPPHSCSPHENHTSSPSSESPSDSSPSHGPSRDVTNGLGGEAVSETESQQLNSSKRNSRTESNSPGGSSSSIHSPSPAKNPLSEEADKVVCSEGSSPSADRKSLRHSPSSSPPTDSKSPHHSPSITPVHAKCSSRTQSDDSLHMKSGAETNGLNGDSFVDLNPAVKKVQHHENGMENGAHVTLATAE